LISLLINADDRLIGTLKKAGHAAYRCPGIRIIGLGGNIDLYITRPPS
jgi:hypothetical protein